MQGLQSALDAKQATILDGGLSISKTLNLQSALDAKQPTINTDMLLSVPMRTMPASCEVRSDINLHSSRSGEARVQQLCPRGATGVAVASASRRTEGTGTKRQLQHITTH